MQSIIRNGDGGGKGKNLTPYSCGGVGINTIHDKLPYVLPTTDFEIVKIINYIV